MINANSFVCELAKKNQEKIKELVTEHLAKEGYDELKIKETIINVMEDKLWNVEEILDIKQFFEDGKVIYLNEVSNM